MKIHSMEFENYTTGQKIERLDFGSINLLVGLSGAGETQILRTLSYYADFAVTGIAPDFTGRFKIKFSIDDLGWKQKFKPKEVMGKIITNDALDSLDIPIQCAIEKETLTIYGKSFVERTADEFLVEGEPSLDISAERLALNVLNSLGILMIRLNMSKIVSYRWQIEGTNPSVLIESVKNQIERYSEMNERASNLMIARYSVLVQIYLM